MKKFRAAFILVGLFAFFCYCPSLQAQKHVIDSSVYEKWEFVTKGAQISNDGKYVAYRIKNHPVGVTSLIMESSDAKWKWEIPGAGYFIFCRNNNKVIYSLPGDSLALLTLGTSEVEYIRHVGSSSLVNHGEVEWLVYSLTDGKTNTLLRNLATADVRSLNGVESISSNDNGINILMQVKTTDSEYTLKWVNLSSDTVNTVWVGEKAENFVFNESGTELAFSVRSNLGVPVSRSFWRFHLGAIKPEKLVDDRMFVDSGLLLDRIRRYSNDGISLFFSFKEKLIPKALLPDTVPVVVWNYKEAKLQSVQENQLSQVTFMGIISIETHEVKRLEFSNELNWVPEILIRKRNNVALIEHKNVDLAEDEYKWYGAATGVEYLVFLESGERVPIASLDGFKVDFRLSPDEKMALYYDSKSENYFSYEIKSRRLRNITKRVATKWDTNEEEMPRGNFSTAFSGWYSGGRYVLLHDTYDLWQIDLLAVESPKNITKGYGKREHIVFRPLFENDDNAIITDTSELILSAFNKLTKDNGFYNVILNQHDGPSTLTMGPNMYYAPSNHSDAQGAKPVKALNSSMYLVSRMGCGQSPNYFTTSDFKNFTQLSNVHPESKYNWITSELFSWRAPNGINYQGVLYKPENFDPGKKYPIIFYYYEKKSDMKNVYLIPEAASGAINVAEYVSKGYLIATPDIHYTIGRPGESALNAVVSAANYLSQKPWVDATKMGIQGMSFGGYETNYIVTHSHLFAAACSAAGLSDLVSYYGWVTPWGPTVQAFNEFGQQRMGRPLSDNFDLYIQNSPLFSAKNVTTPLLMMHTKMDGACPFVNIMEFYALLRRLGKKVWLLQYNDGSHSVWGKSAIDYTIRMQQFFDHFLKGFPEPRWMAKGIPANSRVYDDGLELENGKIDRK